MYEIDRILETIVKNNRFYVFSINSNIFLFDGYLFRVSKLPYGIELKNEKLVFINRNEKQILIFLHDLLYWDKKVNKGDEEVFLFDNSKRSIFESTEKILHISSAKLLSEDFELDDISFFYLKKILNKEKTNYHLHNNLCQKCIWKYLCMFKENKENSCSVNKEFFMVIIKKIVEMKMELTNEEIIKVIMKIENWAKNKSLKKEANK